jgi:hypothetical protein
VSEIVHGIAAPDITDTPVDHSLTNPTDLPTVRNGGLVWHDDIKKVMSQVRAVRQLVRRAMRGSGDDASDDPTQLLQWFECGWIDGSKLINDDNGFANEFAQQLNTNSMMWTELWRNFKEESKRDTFLSTVGPCAKKLMESFKLTMGDCNALLLVEALRHDVFGFISPTRKEDLDHLQVSFFNSLFASRTIAMRWHHYRITSTGSDASTA